MNILITGAGGFIGSRLMAVLVESHCVYGLFHDKRLQCPTGLRIQGDVTDYARMREIVIDCEIDQIYHLAAKSIVRNCRCDPLGCFHANIMGTAAVLEAARQSERVKGIVVMESDKAYGHADPPYHEDQTLCPEGVYEASKASVSHVVAAYHRNYGLPVFSVRAANVYGPGDRNLTRLIPNTIIRLLNGQRPQIVDGSARYVREFLYLEDICRCLTGLMEAKPWGEVFNVGSGEMLSVHALAKRIIELMESPLGVELVPRPATLTEIPEQWLSLDKLKASLPNFRPTLLDEGLPKTITWYKENIHAVELARS